MHAQYTIISHTLNQKKKQNELFELLIECLVTNTICVQLCTISSNTFLLLVNVEALLLLLLFFCCCYVIQIIPLIPLQPYFSPFNFIYPMSSMMF